MILFRRFPDLADSAVFESLNSKQKICAEQISPIKPKASAAESGLYLQKVHLNAAGIDIGADAHWVAVPEDRDGYPVRSFGVFTRDLIALCDWLKNAKSRRLSWNRQEFIGFPFIKCWSEKALRFA